MGTAHPRLQSRGLQVDPAVIRVLVYARQPLRADWVEAELAIRGVMIQLGFSVEHVVSALVEDPPPRPQILVADFDDMTAGELLHLQVLREQGWFGRIIALGTVPAALCSSLAIERVLIPPLLRDSLRGAIVDAGFTNATVKMPAL
jgi:hypothetical protein